MQVQDNKSIRSKQILNKYSFSKLYIPSFQVLKSINILELLGLLIMMVTPIIYKELSATDGSTSRCISSVLFCLPLIFLLMAIRNKTFFALVSFVIMVTSFVESMMVLLYNSYIISGNIQAVLDTTPEEGGGFILSSLHEAIFALPVFLGWLIAIRSHRDVKRIIYIVASFCFACFTVIYLAYQLQIKWKGNITTRFYVEQNFLGRPPFNFWFQCCNVYEMAKQREYISEAESMNYGATRPNIHGKEIYVLAIGESLRYSNLSIGGYCRSTTPLLESLENVTLYSNYYSTATLTMYSVPQIITRATPEDFTQNYKEKGLYKPFQECGFKTFVITSGNLLSYEKYLSEGSDGLINHEYYHDESIVQSIDSIAKLYEKIFFIIQYSGNHSPYRNFRGSQDKYHPNPVSDNVGWDNHEANVNAYDNTVLFTDYNVYNIINAIDKPDTQSAFMMVSDHGADYDTGVSDHGGNCNPRKAEYHVPLIFWHSLKWGENHKEKLEAFKSNKDKPVNADNVFYSVCDMADISIARKYAKPEWSLFLKKLELHDRYILVPDGKNTLKVK